MRIVTLSLALACSWSAPLCAQEPDAMARLGAPAALRSMTALVPNPGGWRAGGFDYDATLTSAGMRFLPALGAAVPSTQHLQLTLLDVRRGGEPVVGVDAEAVPAAIGERAVARYHGGQLVEHFVVTAAGIELSLEFPRRLGGRGDLVARYRVDSSLAAGPVTDAGVSFLFPGVGGVRVGGVTGIDAGGQRAAGSMRLAGEVLELVLPDAFVATAAYPLVLDPLVGTQFLAETGGWNDMQPDVAYDATNDVYLVVMRRVFSATSVAIRGQRISGAGTLVGSFLSFSSGLVNALGPVVANLNLRDSFVVAWQQAATAWDPYDVHCCSVNAATGAVSAATSVAATTADEVEPDITGDNSVTGDGALIAYTVSGAGVRLARVTVVAPGAVPVLVTTTTVSLTTSGRAPAISKSSAGDGTHLLTWFESVTVNRVLRARACDRSGAMLGNLVTVASESIFGPFFGSVDVDGNGNDFLVAYEVTESAAVNGEHDVFARPVRWNGSVLSLPSAAITVANEAGTDQTEPAVGWCRYKFVLLWAHQFLPGTYNYDVRGVELAGDCTNCGSPFQLTGLNGSVTRNNEFTPAIASKIGGGATSDDALLVFAEADDAPPFESSVIAQQYRALGAGGAVTIVGSACGIAGTIGTAGGPAAVGNTDFRVTLTGAQPAAIPFILWGFPGGESVCASCTMTNSLSTVFIVPTLGSASYSQPLPCSTYAFLGLTLQAQWVVLNTTANPCPTVPGLGLSMTQRLRLTIGL